MQFSRILYLGNWSASMTNVHSRKQYQIAETLVTLLFISLGMKKGVIDCTSISAILRYYIILYKHIIFNSKYSDVSYSIVVDSITTCIYRVKIFCRIPKNFNLLLRALLGRHQGIICAKYEFLNEISI